MTELYDVVVVGAGPVGLMLACELRLAGSSVLVLEREHKPDSPWKVLPMGLRGMHTPSIEAIYRRGLLYKLFEPSERPSSFPKTAGSGPRFAGHFAGMILDANNIEMTRWKYRVPGPGLMPGRSSIERIESVLTERAESLGVTILRGYPVAKVSEHDDTGVTLEAVENQTFRGRWVVGCDGGHSIIRKAVGIEFLGTEPRYTAYSAKCDFDPPGGLKSGFNTTETGIYVVAGPGCMHLLDFSNTAFDRTQEITREHLQDALNRVTGSTEVKITNVHLASSWTDRCLQVTSYRKGRILLAGDAAHIHSPLGAQGMNLGLGDAMNLGWKLAATVRREKKSADIPADLTLLDTYGTERHPIGAWVLEWTRAQITTLQPDPYGKATRTLIQDLINTKDGTDLFVKRVWGLSHRYELGDEHPLIGSSAPDFEFQDSSRLGSKLETGRGLLLDFEDKSRLKGLVVGSKYEPRVNYLATSANNTCGLGALLIRPDGVVAWLAEERLAPDMNAAETALKKWFEF